jgi:hypothetical protein
LRSLAAIRTGTSLKGKLRPREKMGWLKRAIPLGGRRKNKKTKVGEGKMIVLKKHDEIKRVLIKWDDNEFWEPKNVKMEKIEFGNMACFEDEEGEIYAEIVEIQGNIAICEV